MAIVEGAYASENSSLLLKVLTKTLEGSVLGFYNSATYTHAAVFLLEAIKTATIQTQPQESSWSLSGILWSPIKYSINGAWWLLGFNEQNDTTVKEWMQVLGLLGIACSITEITISVFMVLLESRGISSLTLKFLLTSAKRALQMGCIGYISSDLKGAVVGAIIGVIATAGEFGTIVYLEISNTRDKAKAEIVQAQQKIYCGFSQAAFLLFTCSNVSPLVTSDKFGTVHPIIVAPVVTMTILMMAITDHKRMRDHRAFYTTLGVAKFGLLGSLLGYAFTCNPLISLSAGAQGIAMWGVYAAMAYLYNW